MKKNLSGLVLLYSFLIFFFGACSRPNQSITNSGSSQIGSFIRQNSIADPETISNRISEYRTHLNSISEIPLELNQFAESLDIPISETGISTSNIIVKFRDKATEAAVRKAISEGPSFHRFESSGAHLIPIPKRADNQEVLAHIGALRELAGVEYAYPDYQIHTLLTPTDRLFTKQQGLDDSDVKRDADIDAPEAWDVSTGSRDIKVAVIDSGVDYNHPDLIDNIWTNAGEMGTDSNGLDKSSNGIDDDGNGYTDDFRGWDFVDNDNDPMDTNGHGTHVAGIIGASGNNGRGIAGVNWQVSIVPLRVLDTQGLGSNSNVVKALEYAARMGFPVLNNSYAGGAFDQNMENAITAARNHDILFVAAAGNEANNNDSNPVYPASYNVDNILVVGASDKNDKLAFFSNYGLTSVDLVAPGEEILSTYLNKTYRYLSGTSMAAPHVAGAAALMKAANPNLAFSQLKANLLGSVDVFSRFQNKAVSSGRLNLARALGGTPSPSPVTGPPPVVEMVSPRAGPLAGGSLLTILGTGFQTGATVKVGQLPCTDVTVVDQSEIHCTLPANRSGSKSVLVTNSDGQSGVLEGAYTYRSAPTLKFITPTRTSVVSLGFKKILWLQGLGFDSGATVTVGNLQCSIVLISRILIGCELPAGLTANTYSVSVTNPEGQVSNQKQIEVVDVTSRWIGTQGGSCESVCKQNGLEQRQSPERAFCTSGRLIPASALGVVAYSYGCSPDTSCKVAQGLKAEEGLDIQSYSQGKYCFSTEPVSKVRITDITVGCYCGL